MSILAAFLAVLFILSERNTSAQVQLSPGQSEFIFNANATAAPQVGTVYSIPSAVNMLSWIISFASAPGSVSTQLECSNDNVVFATCDTSTNVNGEARTIFSAVKYVRATESARSGGGAITVTIIGKTGPIATSVGGTNTFAGPDLILSSGQFKAPDGTAALPSFADATNPTYGFFFAGSGLVPAVSVGGVNRIGFLAAGPQLASTGAYAWASSTVNTATDTALTRGGVGEITQSQIQFANLGTPANGTWTSCSDCQPVTRATCPATQASCICASGGTGSVAFRQNATWFCPF